MKTKVLNAIKANAVNGKFSTAKIENIFGADAAWEMMDELENDGMIEFTEDIDEEFDGIVK